MFVRPGAVIFDLDGVLLDSEPLYTRATEAVLERFGKKYDSALKRTVMGRSPMQSASWLVAELELPMTPEQYLTERGYLLKELFLACPAIEGAEALVRQLHGWSMRMAVATSSEREMYDLKVSSHAWFDLFDCVVCGDDPGLNRAKPAPDIFLLAANHLGVEPERCLVFEDSPAGVRAAKAAKMCVIGRVASPIDRNDLVEADVLVSGYRQLDWKQLFEP